MEMVNGYRCKDCTDVAYAKKNIDPAHPKDGPFGIDRADDTNPARPGDSFGPAVKFDSPISVTSDARASDARPSQAPGAVLDVSA